MRHSTDLVNLVERAERETPTCRCGGSMVAAERDGALWLECAEEQLQPARRLSAILRTLVGHDRRLLLAEEELAA